MIKIVRKNIITSTVWLSLQRRLLKSYEGPGIVPSTENTAVNKTMGFRELRLFVKHT